MRKALLLAAVAALAVGSTALAQTPDSSFFFDIRDNQTANQVINTPTYPYNVGGTGTAGSGQTLFITPHYADNYETSALQMNGWPNTDGDANTATGKLWLYIDMNTDDSGGSGVISSIGLDFAVAAPPAPKNTIGALAFAWDPLVFAGANAGKANGTGGPAGWADAKAALVPVSGSPPAFDTTGGIVPSANHVRLGAISVTGGLRTCAFATGFEAASTYEVRMAVDGLLITRVFSGPPSDAVERVTFGYSGAAPELPLIDGSVAGGTSALADATIVVNLKGDNNGDGRVLTSDNAGYIAARAAGTGAATQRQVFMNDFNGDRRVLTSDNAGYTAARAHSPTCP